MESVDNVCLVCHEHVDIFAIGKCDHPICYKCSTRMRALCEQFYCPICRADLPEVFFLTTKEKFDEMPVKKFITNRKLKIQFENEAVRQKFEQLLEHRCKLCPDRYPEKSFKALRDHMRRVHSMFYCDLCLELKIFSSERKVYNRQNLATHRRVGDVDDKSYKGHPLCQFCEERYLDKDELYKHLRKDHYFCHFCESLGSQEFYDDYQVLKEHFRTDHYLCEEGDCRDAEFTNAFRSDIDLKSHQAQLHSKATNKQQARQERKINIDINYGPRPGSRPHRGGRDSQDDYDGPRRMAPRHQGNRGGRGGNNSNMSNRERNDLDRAIQASLSTMKDADMKRDLKDKSSNKDKEPKTTLAQTEADFPTLGGNPVQAASTRTTTTSSIATSSVSTSASNKASLADRFAMSNNMTVQHGTLNDFPTLSASRSDSPINVPPSRNSNFSISRNQKPVEEDFPELPTGNKTKKAVSSTWVKSNNSGSERNKSTNKHDRKVQHYQTPSGSAYSVNDFPTLGAPTDSNANKKWFSGKGSDPPPSNKPSKTSSENSDNYDHFNTIDRFSPVNVPDSPKTGKNKAKRKKKDKVNDIKSEIQVESKTLTENKSLDDIASLLLSDSNAAKSNNVSKQNGLDESSGVKKEKSKGKKKVKEDKVEKKLEEKEPSVENEFEELNLYGGLDDSKPEPVPVKNEPVKCTIASDDYPPLGSNSAPKIPPPGFKNEANTMKSAAPPGFSVTNSYQPPPGFGSRNVPFSFPEREIIPMSTDISNFQYSPPDDFQERNRLLISAIQAYCGNDEVRFSDFKQISGEFRRSEISAKQYYQRCEEILGEKNLSEIFPELLSLLPDISKQQELMSVYTQSSAIRKDDKVLKISGRSRNAKGAWTATQTGFLSCPTCRQVLSRKDYNIHLGSHDMNSDFPTLADSGLTTSKFTGRSWVKT